MRSQFTMKNSFHGPLIAHTERPSCHCCGRAALIMAHPDFLNRQPTCPRCAQEQELLLWSEHTAYIEGKRAQLIAEEEARLYAVAETLKRVLRRQAA